MVGIYKITSPTGKVYIGQSINIEKRLKEYKSLNTKKQPRLNRSLIKYGFDNHTVEVVCECIVEELNDKERYYQELFDCIGKNGLNCVLVQSSDRSGKFSDEVINKRKGIKRPNHVKLKISQSHKGKKHTVETKLKISKNSKNISEETRQRYRDSHIGHKHTEESKRKISETLKGSNRSEETKLKISAKHGKKVINTITGEVFLSVTKAAKSVGVSVGWFNEKLKGNVKNNTNFKFA